MKKTVRTLLIIVIIATILTTLFGSYIRNIENFASYEKATCVCPPGYKYVSTESVGKRCTREGAPSVEETCTCPDNFVYDGPAAASTRCNKQ